MRLFLDTAEIEQIREIERLGLLAGVTTNPSLVAKGNHTLEEVIQEIATVVDGPISAEVLSLDAEGMIEEGEQLARIAEQVNVKVPMTWEGLKAVRHFSNKGIATNVTLIFSANQALMAARAGATYVSPFVGRLDDIGEDGIQLVQQVAELFQIHQIETQIIAASIRHPMHVIQAGLAGADIATLPYTLMQKMSKHPLTDQGISQFLEDWEKANQRR